MDKNNKIYAVKIGRIPGIYTDYLTAHKQVYKFKGSEIRVFSNNEEGKAQAEKFLKDGHSSDIQSSTGEILVDLLKSSANEIKKKRAIVYTDASYKPETGSGAYSLIFISESMFVTETAIINKSIGAKDSVSVEIYGAKQAILLARKHNINHLEIRHDYIGIADMTKKTKNPIIKTYRQIYHEALQKGMSISFTHVKGHSIDKINNLVDKLAGLIHDSLS